MTSHSDRAHMRLGASSASCWTACPASIRLSEGLEPRPAGQAALDGTTQHEWLEFAVRKGAMSVQEYVGKPLNARRDSRKLTKEWADNVDFVLRAVFQAASVKETTTIYPELKLAASSIHDDCGGTCDIIIQHADDTVTIVDAKFGLSYVPAETPQLLIYAISAADWLRTKGIRVRGVRAVIVQPRSPKDPVRHVTYTALDLAEGRARLGLAARRCDDPNSPAIPGDHCRYCPVVYHQKCPATQAVVDAFQPIDLSPKRQVDADELGRRLKEADILRTYLDNLDERAEAEARAGRCPAGYKLVLGRGSRVWKTGLTTDAITSAFAPITNHDLMPRELMSVAQVEKVVGKERFAKLSYLIENKTGKPTLVPLTDKRPAYDPTSVDKYTPVVLE